MEKEVQRILGTKVFKPTGFGGGGSISSGSSYLTDTGLIFLKSNHKKDAKLMFDGEYASLEAILQTKTISAPKPIAVVTKSGSPGAALVMENLEMSSLTSKLQSQMGEQLARMHLHNKSVLAKNDREENRVNSENDSDEQEECGISGITQFGFPIPTCCGYISQDNTWQDDWPTFYIRQKLQVHVDMLQVKGDRELNDCWPLCLRSIESKLGKLKNIVPSLIHGDLWSGNIAAANSQPVIFDPASFYGHSEYDFGIAYMFSGFTNEFYKSYHTLIPKADGFAEREDIYELFHHLNHCSKTVIVTLLLIYIQESLRQWIQRLNIKTNEENFEKLDVPWDLHRMKQFT